MRGALRQLTTGGAVYSIIASASILSKMEEFKGAKTQLEKEIREAVVFLRTNNQTIPSETIEFMKVASLEKLQGENDWISVKERLPNDDENGYLVYGNLTIGHFYNTAMWYQGEFILTDNPDLVITHWMPLPCPPAK